MRELQGVGVQLKEQKIVDRRKTGGVTHSAPVEESGPSSGEAASEETLEIAK